MDGYTLSPRFRAFLRYTRIRERINDDFRSVNPHSRTMNDWKEYSDSLARIDMRIDRLLRPWQARRA